MRTDKDRTLNTPFQIFTVVVDGKEKTFRARALTMSQATAWCPLAAEFGERLQRASTLNPEARYAELESISELGIDCLKACPSIENVERVNWEGLTFEQVMGAIDEIYEVSDPFAQAQRKQQQALEKQLGMIGTMGKAGVNISQFMPSPDESDSPSLT